MSKPNSLRLQMMIHQLLPSSKTRNSYKNELIERKPRRSSNAGNDDAAVCARFGEEISQLVKFVD
jgi:hypothetical protein